MVFHFNIDYKTVYGEELVLNMTVFNWYYGMCSFRIYSHYRLIVFIYAYWILKLVSIV